MLIHRVSATAVACLALLTTSVMGLPSAAAQAAAPPPDAAKPDAAADPAATPTPTPADPTATPADPAAPAATPPGDPAAAPAPAGPSPEDLEKAKAHFAAGKALFDAKDFAGAVTEFKESYRLSKNPVLLYNVAFTLDQLGDGTMATFYYQKFLADSDATAANRDAAAARVKELEGAGSTTTTTGDTEVTSLQHIPVDEAPPGKPIDVTAVIPEGATWQVVVWYRAPGQTKFISVPMARRYDEMVGRIPASATTGSNVQYYVEVKDAQGNVIDQAGEATSPNLVLLDSSAKARFYPDFGNTTVIDTGDTSGPIMVSGGWTDVGSDKYQYVKWGSTGTAAGLVLLSGTFYLLSSSAAGDLEDEASSSRDGGCTVGAPCRAFSSTQRDLQAKGERYERLAHISLGIGLAAGVGAGLLWYFELTDDGPAESADGFSAVPTVGDGYVGGAATLRF